MLEIVHPRRVNLKGTRVNPTPVAMGARDNRLTVTVRRYGWEDTPDAVHQYWVSISLDGGVTWQSLCGGTATGKAEEWDGTPRDWNGMIVWWGIPEQRGKVARLIRVTSECKKDSVELEVEISSDTNGRPPSPLVTNSVTWDSTSTASSSSQSTISVSVTVANNSDRLLYIGSSAGGSTKYTVDSAVFNTSESFTAPSALNEASGSNLVARCMYLVAPTATTADVVVTFSGGTSEGTLVAMSVYDVDQSTPLETSESSTGTDNTNDMEITNDGVADGMSVGFCAFSVTTPAGPTIASNFGTDRGEVELTRSAVGMASSGGSGSKTFSWTQSNGTLSEGAQIFATIRPTGGSSTILLQMLNYHGG